MAEASEHPLKSYPEVAQVAYLCLLAGLCFADKDFSEKERQQLETHLKALDISDEGRGKIYSAVFSLRDEHIEKITEGLLKLANSDLRFTLISDLYVLALADDTITEEEESYINKLASQVNVSAEQCATIRTVQTNIKISSEISPASDRYKEILKDSAAKLASVSVPVAAIAASGSVFGLSAAGLTSGLAALGALVGGGMLAGTVLVVPALAVGAAYGTKKLISLAFSSKSTSV
jgi:uncharacterized tellurite resistance protein B-like protein